MNSFLNLTTTLTNPGKSTESKLQKICSVTSELIPGADRVSLWTFSNDLGRITCDMCLDENNEFSQGLVLTKADYPEYFEAILTANVIDAAQARIHPATSCFTEGYFKPLNIHSLLDFILHQDFEPSGVLCCESVNREVSWTMKDIEALKKISRASSMHFRRR